MPSACLQIGEADTPEERVSVALKRTNAYLVEDALIVVTLLLTVAGFWNIYLGSDATPEPYHHLHIATVFLWLGLLWYQLRLIGSKRFGEHRRVGIAVVVAAPWVFATTAMLSVHSAHRGVVSGEGDALIVQNVMVTLELGALILLAFVLRKRRQLHGALLMSTTILFMGIALFFTLISFAPPFKIEGPETFYRFGTAGMAAQVTGIVVGIVWFLKDVRNGWPYLLAGASFVLNELIRSSLSSNGLIEPLTATVGALHPVFTFVGSFVLLLALLVMTGTFAGPRRTRGFPRPA